MDPDLALSSAAFPSVCAPTQSRALRCLPGVGEANFFRTIIVHLAAAVWPGTSRAVALTAVFTLTCEVAQCISPMFWSMAPLIMAGPAAAGSTALIDSSGVLGRFVGLSVVEVRADETRRPAHASCRTIVFFLAGARPVLDVFEPEVLRVVSRAAR